MDNLRIQDLVDRADEIVDRVSGDERIILNHAGKQVAIVSLDDLAFLEEVDQRLDRQDAQNAKQRLADADQAPMPFLPTSISEQPAEH
jgi:PHD/YefM family antitoxin component YafN of YafNO toxin-antitoxin module